MTRELLLNLNRVFVCVCVTQSYCADPKSHWRQALLETGWGYVLRWLICGIYKGYRMRHRQIRSTGHDPGKSSPVKAQPLWLYSCLYNLLQLVYSIQILHISHQNIMQMMTRGIHMLKSHILCSNSVKVPFFVIYKKRHLVWIQMYNCQRENPVWRLWSNNQEAIASKPNICTGQGLFFPHAKPKGQFSFCLWFMKHKVLLP